MRLGGVHGVYARLEDGDLLLQGGNLVFDRVENFDADEAHVFRILEDARYGRAGQVEFFGYFGLAVSRLVI